MNGSKRYVEVTDDFLPHLINLYNWDGDIIPIYTSVLYLPELTIDDIEAKESPKVSPIKEVLLYGYASKRNNLIYIEYLNLDGYLERRIYDIYGCPALYYRYSI